MDPLHSRGRDMKSDQARAAHDDSWPACLSAGALRGSGLLHPHKMRPWLAPARRLSTRTQLSTRLPHEHLPDGPHLVCLKPPTCWKR